MKSLEQLAREAGMECDGDSWFTPGRSESEFDVDTASLARFRAAVRAEVLEEAAQIMDQRAQEHEECAELEKDERFLVYAKHERRGAAAIREAKGKA